MEIRGRAELGAFFAAADEATANEHLAALLGSEVDTILRQSISRALAGHASDRALVADLQADARLKLLTRLRALRREGAADAIADFAGYAATVGYNTAYVWLRRRYPERTRLKNQVRYIVTRDARILVEHTETGMFCRRAGLSPAVLSGAAVQLQDDPRAFAQRIRLDVSNRPLAGVVNDVLQQLDERIDLDALVDALAVLLDLPRATPASDADLETIPDRAPDVSTRLDDRQYLERIWTEVKKLKPRQRAALLLNLREPEGGGALALLPAIGVASMKEIATALEMPAETLAALWEKLPLDDLQIADRLGCTRQQVINLRKTARATLGRRLVIKADGSRLDKEK